MQRNQTLHVRCAQSSGTALVAAVLGLLCAGAAALAPIARAAPTAPEPAVVTVTAGEHGEFSRIVLALDRSPDYRAEPEAGGLRVVFPGTRLQFDYREGELTRRAHRVVGAHAEIGSAGSAFVLRFDCACTPKVFAYGGKVVIDLLDANDRVPLRPPEHTGTAVEANSAAPSYGRASARGDNVTAGPTDGGTPRQEFLRRVEALADPPAPTPRLRSDSGSSFDSEPLRRMLAQAIEHGHLTARANAAAEAAPGGPALTSSPAAPAEIRHDREPGTDAAADQPAHACPDGGALDAAAGFGAGSFSAALAKRQDVLGRSLEADEGVEQARLALASFYIARLMPQEALATLAELPREPAEPATVAWLQAVALALADRPREIAEAGRDSACVGADVAVWRATIAAARGEVPRNLLEAPGIAPRIAAYPTALRIELGLRLARAGLDAALAELAAQLIGIVEGASPDGAQLAMLLFLKGRLAALRGDFAGARATWHEAAALPGEGAARAQIALLRIEIERGEPAKPEAMAMLARLAFDWRGHPLQLEVAELAAAAHERNGRPADALDALDQVALGAPGRPKAGAAARLATDLLRRVYADPARLPPADQLAALWRYEGFVPPGPEGVDIRLGFARALLAHGLPGPAADLLEPLIHDTRPDLRVEAIEQLAQARLALAQPQLALELLRGAAQLPQPRPDWNLLAARALADLGRFAEAAGLLHDHSPGGRTPAGQADYLWQAGLWVEAARVFADRFRLASATGNEASAAQAASRAIAAAYMAGVPMAQLDGHHEIEAAAGQTAAALAARPDSRDSLPAARLHALLEETDAVVALARAQGVEVLGE